MPWYDALLGKTPVDSQGQLQAAQRREVDFSKYDQEAKRQGFNSGAEYYYFLQRQNQSNRTAATRPSLGQSIMDSDAMAWHPKNILQRISTIFEGINK